MTLLTKRQLLTILQHWTTDRAVPTIHTPVMNVIIPPSMRSGPHTHARIEWADRNGAGDRLYRLTFWASHDPRHTQPIRVEG